MSRASYSFPRHQPPAPRQHSLPILQRMLANALACHQRGQLADAERIYRQILALDPHHASSLHLLGTLAHQVGKDEMAVKLIGAAIAIEKRQAAYHSNLGAALQALGRLEEAAACYERAIELKPDLAEAQMNLGVVLEAQGKLDLAETRFRRALALKPDLAEAHVNLGNVLQARGKLDEAVASHERALALRPEFVEALFNRANVLQAEGRLEEAVDGYRRVIELKPAMAAVHRNLGNTLLAQNKLDLAEACYERALALQPDDAELRYNQGNLRQAQNKLDEAVTCYESAIQLKPRLPEAHYNLGNTLHSLQRLNEAEASFKRALSLRPEFAEAHYNLGCVFEDLDRLNEAERSMSRALEIKPDYPQAAFGRALVQLRMGDFATGWRAYESRWLSPDHNTPWRDYRLPRWTGEKLTNGRLLLWGEQGVGDEIQFAGLVPEALGTGNRITLDCDARLQPLFARSFPGVEVVSGCGPGEAQAAEIAAHLPTGSLPGIFRTSEAAFAATTSPYLRADPAKRERYRARYGDGRRLIGLAWHTKNQRTGRQRSIGLDRFAPLFALAGIRWISLQYGDFDALEQEAEAAGAPLTIDRGVDQFKDMDSFAAQVAAMDMVITIDNSTAHLAGALGRPVWLLLPFATDWRWMRTRLESPWYPTMHLFRQPEPGAWQAVIEQARQALCGGISGDE